MKKTKCGLKKMIKMSYSENYFYIMVLPDFFPFQIMYEKSDLFFNDVFFLFFT